MTRNSVTDDQYGQLWRKLEEVARRVREGTISFAETMAVLQAVIEGGVKQAVKGVIRLFVDYTRPFADMIRDGKYGWVNSDITEKHFPINQRPNGDVKMKAFHFNQAMESDQVISEMAKQGYRPAELPEALAYAKANPDEQRKYPIVILGSVWRDWDGSRIVPYLDEWDGKRKLHLVWCGGRWSSSVRFLAVRK